MSDSPRGHNTKVCWVKNWPFVSKFGQMLYIIEARRGVNINHIRRIALGRGAKTPYAYPISGRVLGN